MNLKTKPFKTVILADDTVVSVGDHITFAVSDGTTQEGYVLKITTKAFETQRVSDIKSEVWQFADIEEGSVKVTEQ